MRSHTALPHRTAARCVRATVVMAVALSGAGCVASQPKPPAQPHPADTRVTVMRGDEEYPVTAEILDWEIAPNPQRPRDGDLVSGTYRFEGEAPERVELQLCAVDAERVVILCDAIGTEKLDFTVTTEEGEFVVWPGEDTDLSATEAVLLLPDQMNPGLHHGDPKDHDGYTPPKLLGPGDRL